LDAGSAKRVVFSESFIRDYLAAKSMSEDVKNDPKARKSFVEQHTRVKSVLQFR
jgi:hypothetical protein